MLKWIVHVKPKVPAFGSVSSPVVVSTLSTGLSASPPFSPIGCNVKSAGAATPSDVNFTFWPTFTFMQRSGLLKSDVSQVRTRVASAAVLSTNVEQLLTPASAVVPLDPPEEPPDDPPDDDPPDEDDVPPSPDVAPDDEEVEGVESEEQPIDHEHRTPSDKEAPSDTGTSASKEAVRIVEA
jgi:hypothetical protein